MFRESEIFTEEEIYNIYNLGYLQGGMLGKKRQLVINNIVVKALSRQKKYEGCTFKIEDKIPSCWGKTKTFAVDIGIYKDGKLIEIVLIKAPSSNIQQNSINSCNSRAGEIQRIDLDDVNVIFINFMPKQSPYFNKRGEVTKIENNKPESIITNRSKYPLNVLDITITFTIDNIINCITKKEISELFKSRNPIKNITINIQEYKIKK